MRQREELDAKLAQIPPIGFASPRQEIIRAALQSTIDIREQIDGGIQAAIGNITPGDAATVVEYDTWVWADGTASYLEIEDPPADPGKAEDPGSKK